MTASTTDQDPDSGDQPFGVDEIDRLMSDVRMHARQLLTRERQDCSIRPTALVCSGLRRLKRLDQDWADLRWENRQEFFAAMHRVMRQSLVDHARYKCAQRRPPLSFVEPGDLEFYDLHHTLREMPEQIVALEEALEWLRSQDHHLAEVVQHHYFTGLSVAELGEFFEVS